MANVTDLPPDGENDSVRNLTLMLAEMDPEEFQRHSAYTLGLIMDNLEKIQAHVVILAQAVANLQGKPLSPAEVEELEADLGLDWE